MNTDSLESLSQAFSQQLLHDGWAPLFRSLFTVLGSALSEEQLVTLAWETGAGIATEFPVEDCESLEEFSANINAHFGMLRWGYIVVDELEDAIELHVFGSPLLPAWGEEYAYLAVAVLEGLLSQWFKAVGAGDDLTIGYEGESLQEPLIFVLKQVD